MSIDDYFRVEGFLVELSDPIYLCIFGDGQRECLLPSFSFMSLYNVVRTLWSDKPADRQSEERKKEVSLASLQYVYLGNITLISKGAV